MLYVIDSLQPSGGAEQSLLSLASAYSRRGVDLRVAYLHERDGLREQLRSAGADTVRVSQRSGRVHWVYGTLSIVRRLRPDLVHTTLFEADLAGRVAARLGGIPVVTSLVNMQYGPEQLAEQRVSRRRLRAAQVADIITARFATAFHAISWSVAEVMASRLRIPSHKMHVIPRGRDSAALGTYSGERRNAVRHRLELSPDNVVVLSVGRHEYQKGLDVLLRAFNEVLPSMPRARLLIAGREGHATRTLHDLSAELGIHKHVTFLGSRDDVPELLCGADVFVLPSRWEGLGSVLLEAMALECPIVATDLPPVREVVQDGRSALLVPPDDVHSLAYAIAQTLRESERTAERRVVARAVFEEDFTIDRIADKMVDLYRFVAAA